MTQEEIHEPHTLATRWSSVRRCSRRCLRVGHALRVAGSPSGFAFTVHGERVDVSHEGRVAATLRGTAAMKFLTDVEHGDPQHVMARVTGNYKRGNERRQSRRP